MSYLKETLAGRGGEGYIDVAVLILCVILVLALSIKVLSMFIAKQQLDTFATELCREAEIVSRIESKANRRAAVLREKTGLSPKVHQSINGRIQPNEGVTVQLTCHHNLGLFGGFDSFPIILRTTIAGKSEAYWK